MIINENIMMHRKTYFTPEGKVALMFLKMYTGLSSPKLRPDASSDELQTSGRRVFGTGPRAEDPTAAGDTGECLEALHEGPVHDVYGCDLLRERDALPYRSEASVGRNREVICDNVLCECQAECAPSEDEVRRRREGQPVVQEAAQAYEGPDQEADQTPAQPSGEDTEGDTQAGEGEHGGGERADEQAEE